MVPILGIVVAKKHLEVLGSSRQEGKVYYIHTYSRLTSTEWTRERERACLAWPGWHRVILSNEPQTLAALETIGPDERCLIASHRNFGWLLAPREVNLS
ncbi:hypothetical protein PoMZ_03755 [Pyricularia oryzae]|uniref:Uncharacterized protein n=1 Tax=Pyricularia oryzae TaxID=318829 RepID=A0A4P7N7W5_PYROR|nr:hypothetical protein PoMZ_03755 [Pyricularia oryzae]